MKINGKEYKNVERIKTFVFICPYCHKKFNNKNSYRGHLLKNNVCRIIREYEYDVDSEVQADENN